MLAPKDGKIKIGIYTLGVLIYNFLQASAKEGIGFEDAGQRVEEFLAKLDKSHRLHVEVGDIEQLLWAINMGVESGMKFTTLKPGEQDDFERFLQMLFWYARLDHQKLKFDRDFNTVVYDDGKRKEAQGV
jgi:hypothetical protein